MLRAGFCLIFLFSLADGTSGREGTVKPGEAAAVLRKTSAKLMSLSRVSYHYRRELNYASENYHHVLEGDVTIEFDAKQEPIGARYQVRDADGFEIFDGSEILHGVAKSHTVQLSAVHSAKDLDHASFLYNSFVTLRRALPALLGDATIGTSLAVSSRPNYEVDLRIPRAVLNPTGTLSPISLAREITYRISIDQRTMLPLSIRQTNSANTDFTLVEFSRVKAKPPKLAAESWRYTTYKDYQLVLPGPARKPLAINAVAPPWTLPMANGGGKSASLDEVLKDPANKLLLVEFWISHCGYSIDAVPKLNELAKQFSSSGLRVLAVNPNDSEDTIRHFANQFGPHYSLIAHGAEIAEKYGVSYYPTIFLIGTDGTIVYSGEFDDDRLPARISELLR